MQTETSKNLQEIIARSVSVAFHPMFIPLYGLLVIFNAPTLFWYLPLRVKEILFVIFLINNLLIPLSLIPFFRYKHIISSITMETRSERTIPLLFVALLYSITSFIMLRLEVPVFLKTYSYSITILTIALVIINMKWKISLHSAGAGALTAVVLILSLKMSSGLPWYLMSAVMISGLVLSSRLTLDTHSPSEVYTGFGCGFLIPGLWMLLAN